MTSLRNCQLVPQLFQIPEESNSTWCNQVETNAPRSGWGINSFPWAMSSLVQPAGQLAYPAYRFYLKFLIIFSKAIRAMSEWMQSISSNNISDNDGNDNDNGNNGRFHQNEWASSSMMQIMEAQWLARRIWRKRTWRAQRLEWGSICDLT